MPPRTVGNRETRNYLCRVHSRCGCRVLQLYSLDRRNGYNPRGICRRNGGTNSDLSQTSVPSYLFPANSFAAWHAGNLVSGNLSLLQYIRQPGSRVRASRPIHFRMPARTSVQPDITRQNMERAFQYGIFFILSHDFLPRGMDILPPISVVRKNIFHNPLLILHLLRDIHVPARSGTAILLSGSGN